MSAGLAPAAPPMFQSHTIDLGSPVHYADFGGSGPVMVLVHGIASSHLNWTTIAPRLSRRHRVFAVDLPGYGLSRPAPEPSVVETSATYLERFLGAVAGDDQVTLFGHSMGGLVSLMVAGTRPERVNRLLLMAPAAPYPLRAAVGPLAVPFLLALAMPDRTARVLRGRGSRLDAEKVVKRAMKEITGPKSRVPEDVLQAHVDLLRLQRAEHDWTERTLVESAASLVRSTRRRRYRRMVHQVQAPVLLMHGRKDRLVPFGAGLWLHRERPDWEFQPMEGLGHMLHMEDPDWVLWTIDDWLAGHPIPGEVPAGVKSPARAAPAAL